MMINFNGKKIVLFANNYIGGESLCLMKVWGLTLIERCLILLRDFDVESIKIFTDNKKEIAGYLSSSRFLRSEISYINEPDNSSDVILHSNYLYDSKCFDEIDNIENAIYFKIKSIEDLKIAEYLLWEYYFKAPTNKIFLKYVNRPIGKLILKLLINSKLTPNAISLISLLISLTGSFFLIYNNYFYTIAGAVLIELAMCLDCVDGPLARLKNLQSSFGRWFDAISDIIKIFAVYFFLSAGLIEKYEYDWIWMAGFFAQFGFFINIIMWLFSEHVVKKNEETHSITSASFVYKIGRNVGSFLFFFTSMENFYALLLLGSIFKINLLVLVSFALFMNLNLFLVVIKKYFKFKLSSME